MFESERTRQAFRIAFAEYALQAVIDNVDAFYSSWKKSRKYNPVQRSANNPRAATGKVNLDAIMDDDETPLFPGAAAAAPAAAPAPASAAAPAPAASPAASNVTLCVVDASDLTAYSLLTSPADP